MWWTNFGTGGPPSSTPAAWPLRRRAAYAAKAPVASLARKEAAHTYLVRALRVATAERSLNGCYLLRREAGGGGGVERAGAQVGGEPLSLASLPRLPPRRASARPIDTTLAPIHPASRWSRGARRERVHVTARRPCPSLPMA
jgi:hypothetical protein